MDPLKDQYTNLLPSYNSALANIKKLLETLLSLEKITVHTVQGRVKGVDSFLQKAEDYKDPFLEITDYIGLRVICYITSDVEKVCKIIEREFDIDKARSVNKTSGLGIDRVGYESVHYIAKLKADRASLPEYIFMKDYVFEVQIRTILQHTWAEIEHDRNYKFSGIIPDSIKRRFNILSGTLELVDREFDRLAAEIDKYKKQTKKEVSENNYKLEITTASLIEYFAKKADKNLLSRNSLDILDKKSEEIINEMHCFGISTLSDFAILDEKVSKEVRFKSWSHYTIIGYIRDCMIFDDAQKYFNKAWKGQWSAITRDMNSFLKEKGINFYAMVNQYKKSKSEKELFDL